MNSITRKKTELSFHNAIRWGSTVGISILFLRRLIYLKYPGFLPSDDWHPTSTSARWTSVTINSTALLIMLLVLPGVPLCLYLAVRTRKAEGDSIPLAADIIALVALYAATYFLLLPPH
jgi:hypothetical protein